MDSTRRRELDEGDLRWFWCQAEGDLGLSGSGDFERAAQATTIPAPKCPECQIEQVRLCVLPSELPRLRRAKRAKCRACLGLGVVVPTTYPRGNAPASPCEEPNMMRWLRPKIRMPDGTVLDGPKILSAREPAWMGLGGRSGALRKRHRSVRLTLGAMQPGHVNVLHAVYGPAPACFEHGDDVPEAALILAAMNRSLPEQRRIFILARLKDGRRDRFEMGTARAHVNMFLSGSWRAYDRANGRVVDEEREPVVEALAESERLLKESTRLLALVMAERASGVFPVIADDSETLELTKLKGVSE